MLFLRGPSLPPQTTYHFHSHSKLNRIWQNHHINGQGETSTPIALPLTLGTLATGAVEGKTWTVATTEIDRTDQEHPSAHATVTMIATTSAMTVVVDDEMIAEIATADGETNRAEMTEADMAPGIWTGMEIGGNTEMIEALETVTEVNATEGETEKATRSAEAEARVENVPGKENHLRMPRTPI
ncbi:hypothetical protein VE01_02421 [Pseudogymnoascus verrucosus]|uniref:Uncharacterized protein n=1 Tax=Pseudogymnoascus verrucosus TaxID=342668 RepID=A0A1B8GTC1_9PEZI|nr:uncharacterized protein VE01_02421 [Pseudogymnoascus verrucosus]OBT99071.1 hypothetical protein VE01_02421 [Pseudogymnoascus verrucosus]